MRNKKNKKLKVAMFGQGVTHSEAAGMLGINPQVFCNKINLRKVNGYDIRFTIAEKAMLAEYFKIDVNDIE